MSIDTEFVMAAPEVLYERVTTIDHAGGSVTFEAAHWSQSRLELAVIRLDPIVRILEHRDVIDLDPTLDKELFDVAIRQPEPQRPAHRDDDDLGRKPEPSERRTREHGRRTTTARSHPATLTPRPGPAPMQQSPLIRTGRDQWPLASVLLSLGVADTTAA
jgi:hypothetical protein